MNVHFLIHKMREEGRTDAEILEALKTEENIDWIHEEAAKAVWRRQQAERRQRRRMEIQQ
jgi:predicted nucleic acid-binding protein